MSVMRDYRQARLISQDRLARLVGVSTSAISQIERGVNVPRRHTAEAIDDALDAGGEVARSFGYMPSDEAVDVNRLRDEVAELARVVALILEELSVLTADVADLHRSNDDAPSEPPDQRPGT